MSQEPANSEFNPTHKDAADLEEVLYRLRQERTQIVGNKQVKQARASELNIILKDPKLTPTDIQEYSKERQRLRDDLTEIEGRIRENKEEISVKAHLLMNIRQHLKGKKMEAQATIQVKNSLENLISKYKKFSVDRTRIASLRVMASEVVQELESVYNKIQ